MKKILFALAAVSLAASANAQVNWNSFTAENIVTRTEITTAVNNTLINRDWGVVVDGDELFLVVGASQSGNFDDFILKYTISSGTLAQLGTQSLDALDTGAVSGDFRPQGNPGIGNGVVTVTTWNGSNPQTEVVGFDRNTGAFSVLSGPSTDVASNWGAKHIVNNKWFTVNSGNFGGDGTARIIEDGVISTPLDTQGDIRVFDVFDDGTSVAAYYVNYANNRLFRITDLETATPGTPTEVTPSGWNLSDNIRDLVVIEDGVYALIYSNASELRIWDGTQFVVIPFDDIVTAAGLAPGDFPLSPSFEGGLTGQPTGDGGFELYLSNFLSIDTAGNEGAIYRVEFPAGATSVGEWNMY